MEELIGKSTTPIMTDGNDKAFDVKKQEGGSSIRAQDVAQDSKSDALSNGMTLEAWEAWRAMNEYDPFVATLIAPWIEVILCLYCFQSSC